MGYLCCSVNTKIGTLKGRVKCLQYPKILLSISRPKKAPAAINHGLPSESMGVFPYPSSDGTSSAVS